MVYGVGRAALWVFTFSLALALGSPGTSHPLRFQKPRRRPLYRIPEERDMTLNMKKLNQNG